MVNTGALQGEWSGPAIDPANTRLIYPSSAWLDGQGRQHEIASARRTAAPVVIAYLRSGPPTGLRRTTSGSAAFKLAGRSQGRPHEPLRPHHHPGRECPRCVSAGLTGVQETPDRFTSAAASLSRFRSPRSHGLSRLTEAFALAHGRKCLRHSSSALRSQAMRPAISSCPPVLEEARERRGSKPEGGHHEKAVTERTEAVEEEGPVPPAQPARERAARLATRLARAAGCRSDRQDGPRHPGSAAGSVIGACERPRAARMPIGTRTARIPCGWSSVTLRPGRSRAAGRRRGGRGAAVSARTAPARTPLVAPSRPARH